MSDFLNKSIKIQLIPLINFHNVTDSFIRIFILTFIYLIHLCNIVQKKEITIKFQIKTLKQYILDMRLP